MLAFLRFTSTDINKKRIKRVNKNMELSKNMDLHDDINTIETHLSHKAKIVYKFMILKFSLFYLNLKTKFLKLTNSKSKSQ
ncbi:MAG: hypothetical protein LBT40_08355, partial [Deltaproteobacteria bacterium]|nr:hypothetical protein [Deltaproteobacteria bacterium]